ncbi:hypothetical protein AXG93_4012s1020 [Marchantia polymorpha subsp. ruderalis]|uniref:C-terminal of Roc (COR) domain-containing protein n=1 Tax=Marchantia polymorpha subsp. ruderalis TaxID=1480154 RepID=A0A176VLH7_MARPO|nr:hypothetical protein AXG93_4012s1020 [Marchantia polymorpha subsp. ruderalis]
MLSPAAELATRGMDTADEEPELPSAVQDLIRRLEGQRTFGRFPPILLVQNTYIGPELEDFFPADAPLSTNTGWRSKVRLRVLEAIGSCNSFEILEIEYICGRNISRLTAREWEIVLRGFRSSSVLRKMSIDNLRWSSEADLESLGVQLGIILNTSSVTHLRIYDCTLTERFFLNLASGLPENSHSKLKSLEVHTWAFRTTLEDGANEVNAVKFIVEVLNGHHQLETLILVSSKSNHVDDLVVRLLSQALKQNSCLKELVLQEVEGGSAALLLNALAGDDGNRSIERLQLVYMSGIGKCLAEVFISNRSLRVVTLHGIFMPVEEWRLLGEAIRDNATATTVTVRVDAPGTPGNWGREEVARAASSDKKDPVLHLEVISEDEMSALNLLGSVLRGEIKSVKSLTLFFPFYISGGNLRSMEDIIPMNGIIGETSVLSRLHLHFNYRREDSLERVWKQLLLCLRGNTSVTSLCLSLDGFKGDFKKQFRELMSVLQVNLTLREIDVSRTPWARNGTAALIEAALKQNQERAVYMSVFTEAKLPLGDAKAGRLFLCGSPRAGKTQLRRTLMKIIRDKTWFSESLEKLSRTKGIEVDFLQNDDKMQISIWDLAGQWIFRTLQAVLFPQTNYFCVFLFVYSPFCEETSSPKPPSSFRTELEGWLTFISSSTKVMGHNLPQVLVVISHKDKMGSNSLDWVPSIVEDLKIRFANYVDLRPLYDFLYVNARKRNQVIPLKNHIFEMFKTLLSENSPRVPQLCFQLSSRLLSNIKKNKTCPLWSLNDFSTFCDSSLKQLILPSSVDHLRLLTSLLSYLNDVGSIICIPNLDHIIVDPNWLTNSVLGELIAMGQHFQARESKAYENTMPYNSYARKDGFMSEGDFALLIKTFLQKHPSLQDVGREVLEKIIFNLDLGFKLEDSFEYFIPSFIPEYASMKDKKQQEAAGVVSMSWDSKVANPKFFGMRIQCEDGKTMSLSAAFFPHFQVFMRRKLKSGTVRLSRHYLQLLLDGHQIYVEHHQNEKCQNYVDVLMLCSEHKSKEEAIKYVLKHIVQELISFCASPKGCPGVALVLGVIQTVCVEKLIPSHLRGAILIEELKSEFCTSINDKLGDIPLDRLQLVKEEELLNYEHTWPSIPALHLNATFEQATNLLWESEVEAVVNEIPQKHKQLESLQQSIISLNEDLAQSQPECEITISNSSLLHREDCNPDSASCSNQASTSSDTQLILSEIHSVHETVRSVKSIVQGLDVKLISLQKQLQSTFSDFMSKVDRMIKYSESHQKNKTPKRPYVTNDVGLFYKMSALLHVGTVVRLHLMCESVTGFHPVKGQEGLMLRLNKENSRWIPRVIEISYKVLYYAVKAGLDVTLGLGEAIPDWDDLKTDIVKLDNISENDRWAIQNNGHSVQLNEAWLRIQQILEPQLKYRYSEIFKLYKVKYKNGGHAWVCEECMGKGGLFEVNLTC